MKTNRIFYVGIIAWAMLTACVGDLDVMPIDPNTSTADRVYTDTESYKKGLAKLYAAFVLTGQQGPAGNPDVAGIDEAFSCFIRSVWSLQEFTTDEAVWSYGTDANGTIFNLHYQTWKPTDDIPAALYARIMNVVALCNEYIRVTSDKSDPDLIKFNREARFLRALSYYYGLDIFGKMAFISEADKPGAFFPKEISRADLFKYIEADLLAIQSEMGEAKFEYGRADKAACSMLLAKLYLNAEVYLGAGNKKYTEAITELNKVINGPYALADNYLHNFLADNNTSPEVIFSFNVDGNRSQVFGLQYILIFGNAGNGGWSGLRTTSSFVSLFNNNDPRALFLKEDKGQSLEIDDVSQTNQGYGVFKFRGETSTGLPPASTGTGFNDTDFPVFRLADAYLMYAEAVLRGGSGGDLSTAVSYINLLRNRPDDATSVGDINTGNLTLDFILDERGRELYWEGHRRTDLVRYGKFTGGTYLWPWKGGVKNGQATPAYRDVFPIPAGDIATNPNLTQYDEYK